ARGQVNFSEGLALIDRALTASISWNGQQLQIQQATANGFNASGVVNVNLANRGLQAIEGLNLNVRATDLNLQQLPAALPDAVKLAGRADFEGRIAGTPKAPNVNGNLRLRNFVAGGLKFEPLLAGTVNANPGQGVNLQLNGTEDRINVALAPNYQPTSFLVRTKGAVATGTRSGQELLVSVQNFPIDTIKTFAPTTAIASQPLSGKLSGELAVNLNTYGVSGNVAIANPLFASLKGDSFTGTFQYANGVVALTDGIFQQGDSQYLLSGNITQTPKGPQFNAKLDVAQGELKNVLTALQIFDLRDLTRGFSIPAVGKLGNVDIARVGIPEAPLQTQLELFSKIDALITQEREQRKANSPLPDIAEAKGQFQGSVTVAGSSASGITANFDIKGQNWEWGVYSAKEMTAQGNFKDGILTLLPLRFESDNSILSYSGTIGGDAQSGQLQLRQIPIAQLNEALKLPPAIGLTGFLNATATLSGSIKNPQARGEVSLTNATINQTPVQSAFGSFSYNNARLSFGSNVLIAKTEPINIDGSIPFKLPFADVEPTNNQLSLNIDVQNEGLTFLNLLSGGQVSWVNGAGDVKVKVSGTYDQKAKRPAQLVAEGIATVDNATIQARVLPDPLTNVTGKILFDFDRILVEGVNGRYGGGFITAAGTIPISQPISQDNPLTVNIGELAIDLQGLYRGNVQGNVILTGTALTPKIGGQVNLFDGQVSLQERTPTTAASTTNTTAASTANATTASTTNTTAATTNTKGENGSSSPIGFNDLKLTLGPGIQLTRPPIAQFLADGTLTINGSLDNLRPQGTIRVERGQVNLFTTQFRLDRSYENTAVFTPNRGLDPVLDVRLQASVTESTQRRLPTDPLSAEISDAPTPFFGTVQTVRIQAKVQGPVEELLEAESLELTSNPPRSKTEIVALLGGSFVETLGGADSTLGLVNLAGSALLGNVQNVIGDALGLSEFRVFPTIITGSSNNRRQQRSSSLGLSAEAGVDISRNFAVSVLKELTTDDPFQYSLRYRLNDKTLLRGFTDFSGNSGAIVEYETRF
ncbi:MAG TPA: hypothetical protein DCE56_05695, partial [Cyanobacteria bacterium UBA8553]|nr:hypothetical protein [Cyanobacteria bacterium UBA8553]